MSNINILKLQNGFDIRGVSLQSHPEEEVTLTFDIVKLIAIAFTKWLEDRQDNVVNKLTIAVGIDPRLTGPNLKDACIAAITGLGACVVDCGLATTPAMCMTLKFKETNADGAIMITASHLPYNYNGLKLFSKKGSLEKHDIRHILEAAQDFQNQRSFINIDGRTPLGCYGKIDLMPIYSKHLINVVKMGLHGHYVSSDIPLHGFKIIVDAGNGSGGFFVDILKHLGADTTGSIFLDHDGTFPNHTANLEDDEALKFIKAATIESKADLGIIFDTDVDRVAFVDSFGSIINKNSLIALMSAISLRDNPEGTIVTDSLTSNGLRQFIGDLGGIQQRFKRGYLNVINEARRLNTWGCDAPLAIETSGHGAFLENDFIDDGAYLATKVLVEMSVLKETSKTISSLISNLKEPAEIKEYRLSIKKSDYLDIEDLIFKECEDHFKDIKGFDICSDNYEGVRVNWGTENAGGWFLIRMSLHEPILPIHIESDYVGGVREVLPHIRDFIKNFHYIDSSSLR